MDHVEHHHPGWRELVEHSVDVPAVEAHCTSSLIGGRDARLMEGGVGRVLESGTLQAFMIVDSCEQLWTASLGERVTPQEHGSFGMSMRKCLEDFQSLEV